jgi:hypothetical protein
MAKQQPLHIIWFQGELMTTLAFLQASKLKQNHRDARSIHQEHTQILERIEDHLVGKYKTSLHSSVTELNRRTTWDGHKMKHPTQIHHVATIYTAQGSLWIKRVETKCKKNHYATSNARNDELHTLNESRIGGRARGLVASGAWLQPAGRGSIPRPAHPRKCLQRR